MLGKYLKYFPKDSYLFLADPLTKKLPHISEPLPCKYYFFDGTQGFETKLKKRKEEKRQEESKQAQFRRLKHLKYKLRYFKYIFFDLFQFIGTIYGAFMAGIPAIKKEKPTHILAASDSGPSFISSYLLSKKTGVPYSVFLFDPYKGNKFAPFRILAASIFEKTIIRNAAKVFVAGEGIGELYQKLYDLKCITIPNSQEIPRKAPKVRRAKLPLKVVYTGAYYWAQEDAIERFRRAASNLSWVQFDLYSHDAKAKGLPGVSQEESLKIQRAANVLLLPLAFNAGIFHKVIQTAPTGKITEYLVSGVPIIVHAPPDAWICRYLRENKAAVVVDSQSEEAIRKGLIKLKDYNLRKKLVKNAYELAQKNHELKKNSKVLYNELFGGL